MNSYLYLLFSLIVPLAGIALGALAIWRGHQREKRALEVLKIYAEKGAEPTPAMLEALLNRPRWTGRTMWSRFALCATLAAGFVLPAIYTWLSDHKTEWGLWVAGMVFLGLAISFYVQAIRGNRDEQ